MSTSLRDVSNNAVLKAAMTPRTLTSTTSGSAQDLITGDGRCFAIQSVGTVGGTSPTLAGKIQESADGSNWSDVGGGAFTSVAASDNLQVISFDRTQRYLRYSATIGGTSPTVPVVVLVGEQKKQV